MAINLAGLTKAMPKKAKTEKPFLPDPSGELMPLVARSIENKKTIEAHTAALDQAKSALGQAAFAYAARLYQGRTAGIEDSFQIGTATGRATISLKNAYKLPDPEAARGLLGEQANDILRDSFKIEIDADSIPALVQQSFVDALITLARDMDAMTGTPEGEDGAVFQAIAVKQTTTVDKTFHERRWSMFTPEENVQLQQVMPCITSLRLDY
jgi:hypothetical protein